MGIDLAYVNISGPKAIATVIVMTVVLTGIALVQRHNQGREAPEGVVEYPPLAMALLFGLGFVLSLAGGLWWASRGSLGVLPACLLLLGTVSSVAGVAVGRMRILYLSDRVALRGVIGTQDYPIKDLLVRKSKTRTGDSWDLRDKSGRVVYTLTPTMLGADAFVEWALARRAQLLKEAGTLRRKQHGEPQAPKRRKRAAV